LQLAYYIIGCNSSLSHRTFADRTKANREGVSQTLCGQMG